MVIQRIGRIIDTQAKAVNKIGFIQGRLSPKINNQIQAFPWSYWQDEFAIAKEHGFKIIEWTLDQENLYNNPLMMEKGRQEIKSLMRKNNISIFSLTGDCFMQDPFYKSSDIEKENLLNDLKNIIISCGELKIRYIVFPLVDNGKIENHFQNENLRNGLLSIESLLKKTNVKICFESNFNPIELGNFINQYNSEYFGINYDIGNSASMGYDYKEELEIYGHRISDVHIKDRKYKGESVLLGTGDANIPGFFEHFLNFNYNGPFILQAYRDDEGLEVFKKQFKWLKENIKF